MAIAAVPAYLGSKFDDASPGMRFGMYLKFWGAESQIRPGAWATIATPCATDKKNAQNKSDSVKDACKLGAADKQAMKAWLERQRLLADPLLASDRLLLLQAQAVAPFATGLGNEHPSENGFAFLWPYGLPYLPGSGVKGALRAAALELGWPDEERIALFGNDPPRNGDESKALRGALSLWDVLPQIAGDALSVDVMTPHQSHYHQRKAVLGSSNPHDSGQPNPIAFLTVPPGSEFAFHVVCDPARLTEPLRSCWRTRVEAAFAHAFAWLGFGAKTAVGYGAMRRDVSAEARVLEEARQRDRERALATLSPGLRAVREFEAQMADRAQAIAGRKTAVGQPEYQSAKKLADAAKAAGWAADERAAAAAAIELWGPRVINLDAKDLRKRLGLAALRGQG